MKCPNCSQEMQVQNIDNQIVLHCSTCGSSFFDKGTIDNISPFSARKLSENSQGNYVLGQQKTCPKDHSPLSAPPSKTSTTSKALLLTCPTCEGIFIYPDDLLKYKNITPKKAVFSPISRLLPAPKSLFLLSTFAVLSLAILLNINTISRNYSGTTRASDIISSVTTTSDDSRRYVFLYFKTVTPFMSSVEFNNKTTGEKMVKQISIEPKTTHQLTTTNLDLSHDIYYRIILLEKGQKDITGEEKKLIIK